jgi:hypothetical protein
MIFKPTTSSDLVDAVTFPVVEQHEVDLNSVGAWSALISRIVAIATNGGGRLEVRCVADRESEIASTQVFSARIESAAPKPANSQPGRKTVLRPTCNQCEL